MTRQLDEESFEIDAEAVTAALPVLSELLKRFPAGAQAPDLASRLPSTTGEFAEVATDEWDDGDGSVYFVVALLLAEALREQLSPLVIDGDLPLGLRGDTQAVVRHGPLTVRGRLELHADLIVLGDLHVDGRLSDMVDSSRLVVTGSVNCKTTRSGNSLWIAQKLQTDVMCLDPGARVWVGDEICANVVVGAAEARSVTATVRAPHYVSIAEWRQDPRAAMQKLQQILVPAAFAQSDLKIPYFQPEDLLQLAESNRPYLLEPSR